MSKSGIEEEIAELLIKANDPDSGLDEEERRQYFQQALDLHTKSIREEFELGVANGGEKPKETLQFFRENLPLLAANVVNLALNADSESVQLSASKYGIDMGLRDSSNEANPWEELLQGITKNDAKVQPTPTEVAK